VLDVREVETITVSKIDDALARSEDCVDAAALKTLLRRFYPDITEESEIHVLHFELVGAVRDGKFDEGGVAQGGRDHAGGGAEGAASHADAGPIPTSGGGEGEGGVDGEGPGGGEGGGGEGGGGELVDLTVTCRDRNVQLLLEFYGKHDPIKATEEYAATLIERFTPAELKGAFMNKVRKGGGQCSVESEESAVQYRVIGIIHPRMKTAHSFIHTTGHTTPSVW
jgi:hypothetical protein